jgi:hypothetical protein
MSNTILVLKDVYGDEIRINIDQIQYYKQEGHFTTILLNCAANYINVQCSVEDLDRALSESYFMIKKL